MGCTPALYDGSLSSLVRVMASPLSGLPDSSVSAKWGCQAYDKPPNWRAEVFLFVRDVALRHEWSFQQPFCRQHRPYSPDLSQIKIARFRNPKHSQVPDFFSICCKDIKKIYFLKMGAREYVVIYCAPGIYFQILNYSAASFVTHVLLSNSQQ